MKLVIYKDLSGYCVTTECNYNAVIQNARAIIKHYAFATADDIIDYYVKYYNESRDNFIVIDK